MRVDPRLRAEVTQLNWLPVSPPRPPEPQEQASPRMRGDVSNVTRGKPTTVSFAKTKLTRGLGPQAPNDQLKLSDAWRKTRRRMPLDPDAHLAAESADQLDAFLKEMASKGLKDHPQYARLLRLRQSLGRLAEREAKRQDPTSKTGDDPAPDHGQSSEGLEDWMDRLRELALGPQAQLAKDTQRYQSALQLARTGQRDGAIAILKRLVARYPDDAEMSHKLGRLLLDASKFDAAEQHLQNAASARPQNYDLMVDLGELYYQLGEGDLSRSAFFQASMLKSQNSDPHSWLGVLAYESGNIKEAATSLQRAVQLDPGNSVARFYLAQVAYQLNDPLRGDFQIAMVQRLEPASDLRRFKATSPLLASGTAPDGLDAYRWRSPT